MRGGGPARGEGESQREGRGGRDDDVIEEGGWDGMRAWEPNAESGWAGGGRREAIMAVEEEAAGRRTEGGSGGGGVA